MAKEKLQWYAAYTNSRAEKKVLKELQKQGIEAYLPLQKKLRQWSDRRKWVEEPLIRCYIFVRIDIGNYYQVLNTNGIVRYISFEGKAVPIPENQIEVLRKLVANEADVEVTTENFTPGDRVKVVSGPMHGLEGELVDFRGNRRVMIRIDHIGQQLLVSIPAGFLEVIS
ncbi:MAG: UpxY family transcription antiterminator [Bacteroidales bacterium]